MDKQISVSIGGNVTMETALSDSDEPRLRCIETHILAVSKMLGFNTDKQIAVYSYHYEEIIAVKDLAQ